VRCKACNVLLTDDEATRKDPGSGEYLDLCTTCRRAGDGDEDEMLDIPYNDNHDNGNGDDWTEDYDYE